MLTALQRQDIDQVVALEDELFADECPWTSAMFAEELAAGGHYVTYQEGGQVLGYAGLALLGDDLAEVRTIGVTATAQGRGLGRMLLRELLSWAGRRDVLLEVRTDNQAAIALYDSEGFVRQGIRPGYYQPSGADAYNMVRRIR